MARASYPSPNAASAAGTDGLYVEHNNDVPTDPELQLSELAHSVIQDHNNTAENLTAAGQSNMQQAPPIQSPLQNLNMGLVGTQGYTIAQVSASNPAKRTKVSRACDECRRKKVRTLFQRRSHLFPFLPKEQLGVLCYP